MLNLNFDEAVDNLKLSRLAWYNDNVSDNFRDHAASLHDLRNFFKAQNSRYQDQAENHILNLLILLRNLYIDNNG